MSRRSSRWLMVALGASFVVLLAGGKAEGQMIAIQDVRECSADVSFQGATDERFEYPPAPFAYWSTVFEVTVENPDPEAGGSCGAATFQNSEFFPAGIHLNGGTGGSWNVLPGSYSALSSASFTFRVDTCVEYQLDTSYEPGDLGTDGSLRLDVPAIDLAYEEPGPGVQHVEGRLPPGTYEVEAHSYIISTQEHTQGPIYAVTWLCLPCITTLVRVPPEDRNVGCGGTAVFNVVPNAAGLTFQWRRNLVPLANNGHFSGVNSSTLTIMNACHADEGHYDVVLSDGTIVEPSRLAQLTVVTTTGVDATIEESPLGFSIVPTGPNPFRGTTSFRYATASARRATIAVHNAAGAKVRTLVDAIVSGNGVITWDGTTETGVRAPAGIYFLRVEADAVRESRKIVLLR